MRKDWLNLKPNTAKRNIWSIRYIFFCQFTASICLIRSVDYIDFSHCSNTVLVPWLDQKKLMTGNKLPEKWGCVYSWQGLLCLLFQLQRFPCKSFIFPLLVWTVPCLSGLFYLLNTNGNICHLHSFDFLDDIWTSAWSKRRKWPCNLMTLLYFRGRKG